MNKKAYTLFITIILLSVFSYVGVLILETKSIQNTNIQNKYLYIQAKNHKEFLKQYIKIINLEGINNLSIEDPIFTIKALINKHGSSYEIDIFVSAKKYDISLHEKVIR